MDKRLLVTHVPVVHMEGSVGWGMIGETLFSSYWLSFLASVNAC